MGVARSPALHRCVNHGFAQSSAVAVRGVRDAGGLAGFTSNNSVLECVVAGGAIEGQTEVGGAVGEFSEGSNVVSLVYVSGRVAVSLSVSVLPSSSHSRVVGAASSCNLSVSQVYSRAASIGSEGAI